MTDAAPEQLEMARKIAAHALCGPERWKPGVKAGMYDDIMRGTADAEAIVQGPLRAIQETTERAAAWLEQCPTPLDDLPAALRIRDHCVGLRNFQHLKGQDH